MTNGIAYYNIGDDYITDIIYSYIEDEGYDDLGRLGQEIRKVER